MVAFSSGSPTRASFSDSNVTSEWQEARTCTVSRGSSPTGIRGYLESEDDAEADRVLDGLAERPLAFGESSFDALPFSDGFSAGLHVK
jgi:hypothetical protein